MNITPHKRLTPISPDKPMRRDFGFMPWRSLRRPLTWHEVNQLADQDTALAYRDALRYDWRSSEEQI